MVTNVTASRPCVRTMSAGATRADQVQGTSAGGGGLRRGIPRKEASISLTTLPPPSAQDNGNFSLFYVTRNQTLPTLNPI